MSFSRATGTFLVEATANSALEQLSSTRHLLHAWKSISKRNVRSHGLDQVKIEDFRDNIHGELNLISQQLRTRTYKFTAARGWLAPKPGGQPRPIKIPAVRDRVVLKAIALLIEGRFNNFNLDCSFGYVENKGVKKAVARVQQLADSGYRVVLEADIHKFFDEVDRSILFPAFIKRVRRPSLNTLIRDALNMEVGNLDTFSDEERQLFPAADSGIPQGGVLSPMLANFYLFPFDKTMTDSGFNLVRYADDFVVMCRSNQEAMDAYHLSKKILEGRLKLRIHQLGERNSKTAIVRFDNGLKFLGVLFRGGQVTPAESVINKFKERIRYILDPNSRSLLETLTKLRNTVMGWGKYYRDFDVAKIYPELDIYIRESTSRYLRHHDFLLQGRNLSRRQVKLLGIPELTTLLHSEH